jgi:hypothetical protein
MQNLKQLFNVGVKGFCFFVIVYRAIANNIVFSESSSQLPETFSSVAEFENYKLSHPKDAWTAKVPRTIAISTAVMLTGATLAYPTPFGVLSTVVTWVTIFEVFFYVEPVAVTQTIPIPIIEMAVNPIPEVDLKNGFSDEIAKNSVSYKQPIKKPWFQVDTFFFIVALHAVWYFIMSVVIEILASQGAYSLFDQFVNNSPRVHVIKDFFIDQINWIRGLWKRFYI